MSDPPICGTCCLTRLHNLRPSPLHPSNVIARAAQDLEAAKIIVLFRGSSDSQAVVNLGGGITASHSDIWRYQTTTSGNQLTLVLNRRPDAGTLTNSAQQDQQILTASVGLRSGVDPGAITVQIKVLELNAPNPVNPGGGDPIPEEGFVLGHVQGLYTHQSASGNITVASSAPVGIVASVVGGQGTFVNMAPLTGEASSAALVMQSIYRYGATVRTLSSATCTMEEEDEVALNVTTGLCRLVFDPVSFGPSAETTVVVTSGDFTASLPVKVWAPQLPLTMVLERNVSKPVRMGRSGAFMVDPSNLCRRLYSAPQLEVRASFSFDGSSSVTVDVTDVVRERLEVNDTTVAEVAVAANRTVVLGIGNGPATIGFDDEALGSITFAADSQAFVYIDSFDVDVFAGVTLTLGASSLAANATQSAIGVLTPQNMTRPGSAGTHYLGATVLIVDPADSYGMQKDVTLSPQIGYSSGSPGIAAISTHATIVPAAAGTTEITAIWNTSICGDNGSITVSSSTPAEVTLPVATGSYVTTPAGATVTSIMLANVNDPAHTSQSAVAERRVRVKIAYGSAYALDLTADSRTTYGHADAESEALFAITVCAGSSGNMCITANAGVNGTGTLRVTFGHETVIATLTVVVVRAIALTIIPHPFPGWSQSGSIVVSTLRPIDVTQAYEQAQILPSMLRSDGEAFHVTAALGMSCTLPTANAAQVVNNRHATDFVLVPSRPGVTTVLCRMGALLSSVLELTATNAPANVTAFVEISVHGAIANTVHGIQGSRGRHQLRYGATFSDGWTITKANMFSTGIFPTTFRTRLAQLGSENEDVLLCNALNGSLIPIANSPETVTLSVESLNPNIDPVSGETVAFVNLKAGQLDVDFATNQARISQQNPLVAVAPGEGSILKVYVTTGSVRIGALTLGIRFDDEMFTYSSVEAGGDDSIWQDSVLGEVSSADPGLLRIGGVTTNYAAGSNWHFATVTFTPANNAGAGEAVFSGTIIEMVNANAQVVVASGTPIIAGNQTTIIVSHEERRLRRQGEEVDSNATATTVPATTTEESDENSTTPTTTPTSTGTTTATSSETTTAGTSTETSTATTTDSHTATTTGSSTGTTTETTTQTTTPTWQGCEIGRGPYPLGDVNLDCEFSGLDALLTAQYTLVSHDQEEVAVFLTRLGEYSLDAMDADVNGIVDTMDTSVLLYVLFGATRFIQRPVLTTAMPEDANARCQISVSIDVRQSSSDDLFATNPARSGDTAVLAIFTGNTNDSAALHSASWGGNATDLIDIADHASPGRFMAYFQTTYQPGTNTYTADADILLGSEDAIGVSFGISVVQVIREPALIGSHDTDSLWRVPFRGQYMSVGNRYPSENQTENQEADMTNVAFNISESDEPVPFSYSSAFAPMALITIEMSESTCIISTTTTTTSSTTSTSTSSTVTSSTTTTTSTITSSTTTSTTTSTTVSSTTSFTSQTSVSTSTATSTTVSSTTVTLLPPAEAASDDRNWEERNGWIYIVAAVAGGMLLCLIIVVVRRKRRAAKTKKPAPPTAIVSEIMLNAMMIADHGADLGGWKQSENAELWGSSDETQRRNSVTSTASKESENSDGYLDLNGKPSPHRRGSANEPQKKRVIFEINPQSGPGDPNVFTSFTGVTGLERWSDPTAAPAPGAPAAPQTVAELMAGAGIEAREFTEEGMTEPIYDLGPKQGKKTMRRRMSFFNKGGKTRGKLTRDQLKYAEAERKAEKAALRPDGSMARTMARPVVQGEIEKATGGRRWSGQAAHAKEAKEQLRSTANLTEVARKQRWLDEFNNNTVWSVRHDTRHPLLESAPFPNLPPFPRLVGARAFRPCSCLTARLRGVPA